MGLDMYLSAQTYLDNSRRDPPERKAAYQQVMATVGIESFTPANSIPFLTIRICVADWKNAYHIHRWFVEHVQNGKDECIETEVYREQVQELADLCKQLLRSKDCRQAAKSLPLPDGFSLEDADTVEGYWRHLEATAEQLETVLNNPDFDRWDFSYRSSW